jgi:hypothetical protein
MVTVRASVRIRVRDNLICKPSDEASEMCSVQNLP